MFAKNCVILSGSGIEPCNVILSSNCVASNTVQPSFRMYKLCDVWRVIFSRDPSLEYSASFVS